MECLDYVLFSVLHIKMPSSVNKKDKIEEVVQQTNLKKRTLVILCEEQKTKEKDFFFFGREQN